VEYARLIWRKALARKAAYGLFWGWLLQSPPSPPTPAAPAETKIALTGVALFRDATRLSEGGRNEQHEKNVSDPKLIVAHHGARQRHGIGGNQTRSDYLFL
jgi:hypothetical protein